ncbi:MAG: hypothetical protein ABMA64_12265 [Myxococcota bacterium]
MIAPWLVSASFAWAPLVTCPGGDEQTWDTDELDVAVSTISFPGLTEQDSVIDAVGAWDDGNVRMANIDVVSHLDGVTGFFDNHDEVNIVGFASGLGDGVLGYADVRGQGCFDLHELVEADIQLNASLSWSTPSRYYDVCDADWGGDEFFLDDTVRHEVGHALGLAHVGMSEFSAPGAHLATMFQFYEGAMITGERAYIDERPHVVSEDDRVGVRALYPAATSAWVDVAVASYFHNEFVLDNPDECKAPSRPSPATVDLTQMAIDGGLPPGSCPIDPATAECVGVAEPPLPETVVVGAKYEVRFTYLNLGTDPVSPSARLILTQENDPTPVNFTVLDTWTPTLNPNTPFDEVRDFTLPTVPFGVYYVIAQLDYDLQIWENDEQNNESFFNQQLAVTDPGGCACTSRAVTPRSGFGALALLILAVRRRR